MKRGILVASDEKGEWLLPWFWERYTRKNSLPIAFVDFGMSPLGKTFCADRGEILPLTLENPCVSKNKLSQAAKWEEIYGDGVWQARESWFKKPAAFLLSPFEKTLWLDIDCEVLEPLDSLFDLTAPALAMETDAAIKKEGEMLYNSGVILYEKNCPLIAAWAESAYQGSKEALGDQQLLSRLILARNEPITLLDPNYNWRMAKGLNINAAIIHWVGAWGKEYIKKHGGLADDLQSLIL